MATKSGKNPKIPYEGFEYGGSGVPLLKTDGALIKWYNTNLSYEDKYRFGLLTYPEYLLWQEELMAKAIEVQASESGNYNGGGDTSIGTGATAGTTFWQSDTENRANVSKNEYEDFLAQNSIDVSNTTTLDIDSLLRENGAVKEPEPEPVSQAEVSAEEILSQVNRDIHGGNDILSQEEIEALFAAAAANN